MKKIGFIGTGVMGASMAKHLRNAGHEVWVYTRTPEKAAPLLEAGCHWAESPAVIAHNTDVIATMVGYPHDVYEVYLGEQGLAENGRAGQFWVDFTTSSPQLAIQIAEKGRSLGIGVLDAPVSGGDVGAREARLSIMCGGSSDDFDALLPMLNVVGQNIILHGEAGAGQHAKMCNQITICGLMMSCMEALLYAKSAGLDPEKVLESVGSGAATSWTLQNLMPRVLQGNLNPGFFVRHFIKDMDIALAEAHKRGLHLPALEMARDLYGKLADQGYDTLGTHALWLIYAEQLGA